MVLSRSHCWASHWSSCVTPLESVAAFADECPHRGAPLSLGRLEGEELVCAFHGWRFGLDGAATCIPALGADAPIPSRRTAEPAR